MENNVDVIIGLNFDTDAGFIWYYNLTFLSLSPYEWNYISDFIKYMKMTKFMVIVKQIQLSWLQIMQSLECNQEYNNNTKTNTGNKKLLYII